MRRFEILTQLGYEDAASQMLGQAFRKYPNDPHLLSVQDYIMQQQRHSQGTVNEGQMLNRMARKAEAASESGLVLPGQEAPAGEAGKSKLWLPGS